MEKQRKKGSKEKLPTSLRESGASVGKVVEGWRGETMRHRCGASEPRQANAGAGSLTQTRDTPK